MRCLVLGYFGFETNQIDGQTIKTREVYNLLKEKLAGSNVHYFDTESLKVNKFCYLKLLWCILISKTIIYLPGENNLRSFYPKLYILLRLFKKELLYIVVGGWLFDFLNKNLKFVSMLKNEKGIFVETEFLKDSLSLSMGFTNVVKFPNFRNPNYVPQPYSISVNKIKLVFMARIMREKGLKYIFDFAASQKERNSHSNFEIHFYGPISDKDKDYFFESCKEYDFVSYLGIVCPEKVYNVLEQYDLLLLPTLYEGEGFPGTIIDAYIAGIPVLASEWKQIPEFVKHGQTGFLFDLEKQEDFNEYILYLFENRDKLDVMKNLAKAYSEEYSSLKAWNIIKAYL